MSEKHATLNLTHEDGTKQAIDLGVHSGTLGPDVVDVGKLTAHGYFTYDPGFTSTAACESQITFIDGEKGVLLHRGYPIEQLAEHSDYLETCYLLLNGELPTAGQKEENIFCTRGTYLSNLCRIIRLAEFSIKLSCDVAFEGTFVANNCVFTSWIIWRQNKRISNISSPLPLITKASLFSFSSKLIPTLFSASNIRRSLI